VNGLFSSVGSTVGFELVTHPVSTTVASIGTRAATRRPIMSASVAWRNERVAAAVPLS